MAMTANPPLKSTFSFQADMQYELLKTIRTTSSSGLVRSGINSSDCPRFLTRISVMEEQQKGKVVRPLICYQTNFREVFITSIFTPTEHSQYGNEDTITDEQHEKKLYKQLVSTCHCMRQNPNRPSSPLLLVGFSTGEVHLTEVQRHERAISHLFNDDRSLDKSKCTNIAWVPDDSGQFLVAYNSGNLLLFDKERLSPATVTNASGHTIPASYTYNKLSSGPGFTVSSYKWRGLSSGEEVNPVIRISLGNSQPSSVNAFSFSPITSDGTFKLATVTRDGFLRIFDWGTKTIVGQMRSYFGGLLCVAWSSDGKFIATGGENDLISIYSVEMERVICRGQGHHSWIGGVVFIPQPVPETESSIAVTTVIPANSSPEALTPGQVSIGENVADEMCYELISVGQDGYLCAWEITADTLQQARKAADRSSRPVTAAPVSLPSSSASGGQTKALFGKKGVGGKASAVSPNEVTEKGDALALKASAMFGTALCPRWDQIPVIVPTACRYIHSDRLSDIQLTHRFLLVASADGAIQIWRRPVRLPIGSVADTKEGTSSSRNFGRCGVAITRDSDGGGGIGARHYTHQGAVV